MREMNRRMKKKKKKVMVMYVVEFQVELIMMNNE